jgi:hypothetical protein
VSALHFPRIVPRNYKPQFDRGLTRKRPARRNAPDFPVVHARPRRELLERRRSPVRFLVILVFCLVSILVLFGMVGTGDFELGMVGFAVYGLVVTTLLVPVCLGVDALFDGGRRAARLRRREVRARRAREAEARRARPPEDRDA